MNPFLDYQLPEAILKLRQGIGRLIRNQNDVGVCALLDPRILSKRYGELILDSIHLFPNRFSNDLTLINESKKFLGCWCLIVIILYYKQETIICLLY